MAGENTISKNLMQNRTIFRDRAPMAGTIPAKGPQESWQTVIGIALSIPDLR
jgi:hypothetical protein